MQTVLKPPGRFRSFVNRYPHHHSLICNAAGGGLVLVVLHLMGRI